MDPVREVSLADPLPCADFREAAFVAVTAWSPLYADYHDGITDAERTALYPLVLMSVRWDGCIGFPGGKHEAGEALTATAVREAREEANLALGGREMTHVVSHETDALRVHLFRHHLGTLPRAALASILRHAADAEHAIAEGSMAWVHLADYGSGHGFHAFRAGAHLATAVGEELDALRAAMMDEVL